MKILFNQTQNFNNIGVYNKNYGLSNNPIKKTSNTDVSVLPSYSLAYFPNINFGRSEKAEFLIKQAKWLRCAYSGRKMLLPKEVENISNKLDKTNSAEAAIKILEKYESYMHDTEYDIFQKFKEATANGATDFQEILKKLQPDALVKLKQKQIKILTSTDKYINKMSEPVANLVKLIKDNALLKIKDNSFGRQPPLEMIKSVKATGEDLNYVIKVYQAWYKLPNSPKDTNAFIVKYARKSHKEIAKRLICSAQATIEHIHPTSRLKKSKNLSRRDVEKRDRLSNMILVSARFNNERHSMPLDEYIMLNSEINIPKHLQKYINLSIQEVNKKNSGLSKVPWYPKQIVESIYKETHNSVNLTAI